MREKLVLKLNHCFALLNQVIDKHHYCCSPSRTESTRIEPAGDNRRKEQTVAEISQWKAFLVKNKKKQKKKKIQKKRKRQKKKEKKYL